MPNRGVLFLFGALLAGVLGFWIAAGIAAHLAKLLFFLCLVLFAVAAVRSRMAGRRSG